MRTWSNYYYFFKYIKLTMASLIQIRWFLETRVSLLTTNIDNKQYLFPEEVYVEGFQRLRGQYNWNASESFVDVAIEKIDMQRLCE